MRLYRTPKASLIVGSVVSGCLIVVSILFFWWAAADYLSVKRLYSYEPLGIDVDLSVPGITKASFEIPDACWHTSFPVSISGTPLPEDMGLLGQVRIVKLGHPQVVSQHFSWRSGELSLGLVILIEGKYDLEIEVTEPAPALAGRRQVLSARNVGCPMDFDLALFQFMFGAFCAAIATGCAVLVIRSYRRKKAFVEFANELASGSNAGEFAEEGGLQQRAEGDPL